MNNSLKSSLKTDKFHVLYELQAPDEKADYAVSAERCRDFVNAVETADKEFISSLVINSNENAINNTSVVNFASYLELRNRSEHILTISGRNSNRNISNKALNIAYNHNFSNLNLVSGNFLKQNGDVVKKYSMQHYESVRGLLNSQVEFNSNELFCGATVNPFKYTPEEIFFQYSKLVKKVEAGANYIISRSGWDMRKFQELRWYLECRELYLPVFGSLQVLTPESVERIILEEENDVVISPDFFSIIKKELRYGAKRFQASQWRKLQLMVVGLKLMGFNGVVISGLTSAEQVEFSKGKIAQVFEEFSDFETWRDYYTEYLARTEMYPYPYKYYVYRNLLSEPFPEDYIETSKSYLDPTKVDLKKYNFSKSLFEKGSRENKKSIVRNLVYRCNKRCKENQCHLHNNMFKCFHKCPKGMMNGPCGGSKPGGICESLKHKCFFEKVFRLASYHNLLEDLEKNILD